MYEWRCTGSNGFSTRAREADEVAPVTTFFVSHSNHDQTFADRLCDRLIVEGFHSLFLAKDSEKGIPVGSHWQRELALQLEASDAVIFISSPASTESQWCHTELYTARQLQKPVFPILIGGKPMALLADIQHLDFEGKGERAFGRLWRTLRDAGFDPHDEFQWDLRRSPYPGLHAFEPADAAIYFGRDEMIEKLFRLFDARGPRYSPRCVAVVGPSGSGKSSLVRAGLIPRLQRSGWEIAPPFTPGTRPLMALARRFATFLGRDRKALYRQIKREPRELIELAQDAAAAKGRPVGLVLVVDQAEELATQATLETQEERELVEMERELFATALTTAVDAGVLTIVASFRSEFLTASLEAPRISHLIDESLLLGPLDKARLHEVIERPARRCGREFQPGLVSRMVDDTEGGAALPLLAYTLRKLWDQAGDDRIIPHSLYNHIGGVLGALNETADRLVTNLSRRGKGDLVLPTLLKLATVDAAGQPARRRVRVRDLDQAEHEIVSDFVDARLLRSEGSAGEAIVEVAHEALLRAWPPLKQAIDASGDALRRWSEIERASNDWESAGRRDSYLLRGDRLAAARAALKVASPIVLDVSLVREFVTRSARRQKEDVSTPSITILEGPTCCACDDVGDFQGGAGGLFVQDTRHLSHFSLTINGERPLPLVSDKVDHFSAAFYLRNPVAGGLAPDSLVVVRERFVGEGMQDRITVQNAGRDPISLELGVDLAADFADIVSLRKHHFSLSTEARGLALPTPVSGFYEPANAEVVLEDPEEASSASTRVRFSQRGEASEEGVRFRIDLAPKGRWEVTIDVVPEHDGHQHGVPLGNRRFGAEVARVRDSLAAWQLRIPQLRSSWEVLDHAFMQSVADLASLRMHGAIGKLPAAGAPWFMTVVGRTTVITCLQTLLFGPELARAALEVLTQLQAPEDDPSIDAEPGKIVHEVRHGKAARVWFAAYYGTVDATPLYLILLSEVWRWTGDATLVRSLKEPALRALDWIDRYGDRDGDGFVEFERRSPRGLEVQSWKDSGDSQRFSDGALAQPPIAACEVQGYVYDAKRRLAELAREVWRDYGLAQRLEAEAAELRRRFDEAFWIEARGGYYALALDRDKKPVDSLCSNVGHLLWSGIVLPERVYPIVDALMGEALWSGWGVRTMSTADAAYNPLSYHNGTVWPHDNSLIAAGLARYAHWPEAQRIIRRMLEAASHFRYQLPEVFAGMPREETPFPIAYPTAARPHAWAAGTPVLLLQLLLGLQPDTHRNALVSIAPPELPNWAGSLRLAGVRAFDRIWDVRVENGMVGVQEEKPPT